MKVDPSVTVEIIKRLAILDKAINDEITVFLRCSKDDYL